MKKTTFNTRNAKVCIMSDPDATPFRLLAERAANKAARKALSTKEDSAS